MSISHGGRLDRAMKAYGGTRADWLDCSTGINPHAYPIGDCPSELWEALPDEGLTHAAEEAAARLCYGAGSDAGVVAAPGTQALIQALPHLVPPAQAAIVGPTYQEHAICWQRAGHRIRRIASLEEVTAEDTHVIVVNPNNPDGRVIHPDALVGLGKNLAEKGGFAIVDEAFADLTPDISVSDQISENAGLIVLRSFGKFFGLAGLRLGFAILPRPMERTLREWLGPWAVSGPALAIGARGLADAAWQSAMREKIAGQVQRLREGIGGAGLEIVGDAGLFVLARHPHAPSIHEHLCKAHILTRVFDHDSTLLRFGLTPDRAGEERFIKALSDTVAASNLPDNMT